MDAIFQRNRPSTTPAAVPVVTAALPTDGAAARRACLAAAAELVGVDLHDLILPPEAEALLGAMLGAVGRAPRVLGLVVGGEPRPVQLSVHRSGDGLVAVLADLAPGRARWSEIERHLRDLESIVENSPDIIARFDRSLRHIYVNRAVEPATGLSREDFLGRDHVELGMPDDLVESWQAVYRQVFATGTEGLKEFEFETPDGVRSYSSRVVPEVDEQGQVVTLLSVARDVTDLRRAQAARLEVERRLQLANKLESLGTMAGGVAHDFNNLLVGVLGSASLLAEVEDPAERRELLAHIESSAGQAAQLCRQLLSFAGRDRVEHVRRELGLLVDEAVGLLAKGRRSNVEVLVAVEPGLIVDVDPSALAQLVVNLVLNACEASEPGGRVRVGVRAARAREVEVRDAVVAPPERASRYALLEVSDDGCGMDGVTLQRIFDPFFTTRFQGRGLGLATALGTVRNHAGVLRVDSAPGVGTTFQVFFPMIEGAADAPTPMIGGRRLPSARVLVVDDEPEVRAVTVHMVRHLGAVPTAAESGAEALELLDARRYDLVLLDLTMPGLDGLGTLSELRRRGHDVEIVLMSGDAHREAVHALQQDRVVHGFLEKPFRLHQLEAVLAAALRTGER